jgi:hypothetical protein
LSKIREENYPKKLEEKESCSEIFFDELRENSKPGKNDFAAKSSRPHHDDDDDARRQCACVCDRACRSLTGWLALVAFPTGIPWQRTMKGKDLYVAGNLHKTFIQRSSIRIKNPN